MPIIKSAKKKMVQDRKRTKHNEEIILNLKSLIKNLRRSPSTQSLQEVQSKLDKAVKINLIHANKAARLKSRLSTLTTNGGPKTSSTPKKSAAKKAPVKKTSKKK